MDPKNCPMCGDKVTADYTGGWSVACGNCYDGAPDAGRQLVGESFLSAALAVSDWNYAVVEFFYDRDEEADADAQAEKREHLRWREIDRQIDMARGK